MSLSQGLYQKQLQKLSPQQIQLMKLLQIPTANLEERIKEEIEELNDAIKVNDVKETRDALGDILYVVYGMADILGIDIDYIFRNTLQNEVFKYYLDIKTNDNLYLHIDKLIIETENGLKSITNFNSVKIFFTELLGNEINEAKNNKDILNKKNINSNPDTYIYILDKIIFVYLHILYK